MRLLTLCTLLLFQQVVTAQIDYRNIDIEYGNYEVGYRHLELIDSSRIYSRIIDFGRKEFRPVSISVWEPADVSTASSSVTVKDYLMVHQAEEEWPHLPFEYFFDWFSIPPTTHNKAQIDYNTQAKLNYTPVKTEQPIIIYNASFRSPSTENFILCEYLASHGYTVLAIPSKGYDNINFQGGTIKDAMAQSLDLNFVIDHLPEITNTKSNRLYLTGFSFGGLSHILNACNDGRISGVISLDGTIKYKPEVLASSVLYNIENFKVPFIHISQKDIPESALAKEQLTSEINKQFTFYDEIEPYSKYQIKSKSLSHSFFSTYGLLFKERDLTQDVSYDQINQSYGKLLQLFKYCVSSLHQQTLQSKSEIDTAKLLFDEFEMVKSEKTYPQSPRFVSQIGLEDMGTVEHLEEMYQVLQTANPSLTLSEGDLNVLGLQLIFQKETFKEGVSVFRFALTHFPNSANLHDSLAEGYRYNNELALAKFHFKKSLELYAGNENAKRRLQELED
ncbi:MAG: hypothetical protein AAF705_06535 [Bacteroidota bacterium]